ncbi:MAG: tetraacyldisaccharide 4'-kinase [Uliginosibacterium sp.]|jgi:tetraacyldisaccharide 4'-kinase|nr:tetraacyldisaccharide 4'-kinase [Uliginosibacterium sp.]MBK9615954.1 tetraacyldisaccharide 4'-kinase [Uliginosibacterium sp.]
MALTRMNRRPAWWRKRGVIAALWLPLAGLFAALVALRRWAFGRAWLPSVALPVRVIVVGNIAVGGSGKTPVVIWLAAALQRRGWHPGIVSRGYGGSASQPTAVTPASDPAVVGDEPVMLARRTTCPVWVGRDRVAAGRALLAAHPEVDVVLTDDGLQHYRLRRDAEVIVIDESILGNTWPLPAGPLREPLSRMADASLLICHGETSARLLTRLPPVVRAKMRLEPGRFYRLGQLSETCFAEDFAGQRLCAAAGIAHPERFFDSLRAMGLTLGRTLAFPDHFAYTPEDFALEPGEVLLLTEKDAVKCASFALADAWVLPVEASIDSAALDPLLELLYGPKTA